MELRELLDESGLYVTELAKLLKVSRICIHHWLRNGVKPRQQQSRETAELVLGNIEKAVQQGLLPLKGVRQGERFHMIIAALQRVQ